MINLILIKKKKKSKYKITNCHLCGEYQNLLIKAEENNIKYLCEIKDL